MAIKEATDATFEELVLKNDRPVLVYFWACSCGPGKLVAPEMEKLAEKMMESSMSSRALCSIPTPASRRHIRS